MIAQPADDYLAARSRGTLCRHDTEHDAGDDGDESTLHHLLCFLFMLLIARIFECL
jgi:hypothetical protein